MLRRSVLLWPCAFGIATTTAAMGQRVPLDLHQAAARNDAEAIDQRLRQGAPMETRDAQGRTPLMVATHENHVQAARALIEAGADVNAKDAIQDSPYLYAGARGLTEILQLTLDHGADLRSTNRYGGTALIPACERGHVEAVEMLLKAGVAVNHVNRLGWSGLMEAIVLSDGGPRHQRIVQLLIDAGADVNLPDSEGVTPLTRALQRRQPEIAAMLRRAGAKETH